MDFNPVMNALMADEHEAWLIVVDEFRAAVGDMNEDKFNPLIKAIEVWGELLVSLRLEQSPTMREVARTEKLGAYLASK